MDAALDGLIALGVELGLIHAWPIEAVGGPEPLLRLLPRKRRGVVPTDCRPCCGRPAPAAPPSGRAISATYRAASSCAGTTMKDMFISSTQPAIFRSVPRKADAALRRRRQIVACAGAELDILFAPSIVVHIVVHLPVADTGADRRRHSRQSVALLLKAVQLFRLHIVPQKGPAFPDGMAFPAIQKALRRACRPAGSGSGCPARRRRAPPAAARRSEARGPECSAYRSSRPRRRSKRVRIGILARLGGDWQGDELKPGSAGTGRA